MGCVRVKFFWPEVLPVRLQLSNTIRFKFVAYKTYRLWVPGVNYMVISIPLVTSLFYLLRNSYRGVLVICSVPELHHPYLETRSGTLPQTFCHTLAGLIFIFESTPAFCPAANLVCFRCSYDSGDSRSASQSAQLYAPSSSSLSCISSPRYKPICLILHPCLVFECAFIPWLISMTSFEMSVESSGVR